VRYGLKEDSLARVLVEAVGINAESASAKAAKNWCVPPQLHLQCCADVC
jgi:hypothetical protein